MFISFNYLDLEKQIEIVRDIRYNTEGTNSWDLLLIYMFANKYLWHPVVQDLLESDSIRFLCSLFNKTSVKRKPISSEVAFNTIGAEINQTEFRFSGLYKNTNPYENLFFSYPELSDHSVISNLAFCFFRLLYDDIDDEVAFSGPNLIPWRERPSNIDADSTYQHYNVDLDAPYLVLLAYHRFKNWSPELSCCVVI